MVVSSKTLVWIAICQNVELVAFALSKTQKALININFKWSSFLVQVDFIKSHGSFSANILHQFDEDKPMCVDLHQNNLHELHQ